MFREVYPDAPKRRAFLLSVSVALHFSFLVWLLRVPAPTFLAPSSVIKGERTGSATTLYLPSHWGQDKTDAVVLSRPSRAHQPMPAAQARITWTRSRNIGKSRAREVALSKTAENPAALASNGGTPPPPLGSPYGSALQGTISGFEVRPALWAYGSDPLIAPSELDGLEGTVIVKITIDEQGNVVRTAVLQSLSAAIDAKVVAALEKVLYHFPQRR